MKRIMGVFLALVMFIGYLPLNPTASYANGDVEINEKNFPDENFRDFIDFFIDEDNNGFLNHEELDQIDQLPLNGGSTKITNLKGIEYFKNLKILNCAGNELEYLDVSHNPKLTELDCSNNKLTRLNVSHNPELTKLNCRNNNLTSLDVRNSPNLTEFWCGNQQYDITVNGLGEFKYSNFPGSFDLRRVIINSGATYRPKYLQLWDNDIKEVTYRYRANDDREMYVKLNVHRKFDPDYVESMIVKTQPTKLSYTEGDRLDLTRLVVTLKDKQGLKEEAKLEEFTRYGIKTDPENRANLTLNNNNKPVTIRKGNAQCETDKLIVKAKVVVPDPANPGQVPTGRVRVTFDAGDGNTIDGNRYKVIDVLTGTKWDNAKVKEQIPASATYKDNTKEFNKWSEKVPTTGTVEAKRFTAEYKAKELVTTGTNPNTPVPVGYTRVTFDAGEGNKIDGTNRYKVIDVLTGTAWDNAEVTKEFPASATYKDATKVFNKWSEAVPTTGTVETKTFTAEYKAKERVKTGTDPSAQVPDGYTRVTFDAGEDNTINGTNNRYKVIDILTGTAWDNAKVKEQIPLSATYKDNTKEFDKWSEAVPTTGTVEAKTFIANYKAKKTAETGTNPSTPVPVGYTRVTFDAGEGNKIDGNRYKVIDVLTGTAWDNAEVTKELPKSTTYKDNTKEFEKWSETVPITGTVEAKTFTAEYKAKELVTTGTDPNTPVPVGYTRVTFDAGDGNTIDGTNNRYKVIDVLNGTKWDNQAVKKEIPTSATYKDNTKEFKEWDSTVPDTGEVEEQEFVAIYKAKELVTTGTNPSAPVPVGYTRVTFDAGEGNKIDGNRYKVIDVLNGTKWDNQAVKKEIPASAKYKDNTKEFNKWSEKVPTTGTVEAKRFTAEYKAKELVTTGTNPNTPVPVGYTRVTFDATEDGKIEGNRYKVIDVLNGTKWDNAKVKEQIPASAKYKDNTKEFDKWSEAVPTTGTVETKTFKAEYKAVGGTIPTPTALPVVGPVDPTQPSGKPADTSKYWTVTFVSADETKGTVSAKNTVYVLKTETKTLADITAPKVTAKEGYEFDKWEPALTNATTINKDLKVKAYFKKVKEKSYNKKQQVANNSKMPKTANSINIELYTVFMILSVALLVIAVKKRKES